MERGAEELLQKARKLKKEVRAFGRDARDFLRTRPEAPEEEREDLESDVLGTVEMPPLGRPGARPQEARGAGSHPQAGLPPEVDLIQRRRRTVHRLGGSVYRLGVVGY